MLLAKKFRLLFLLPLLLICLAAWTEANAGSGLIVTGRVVDAKGAGVADYSVQYFEIAGKTYRMRIIKGRLANPNAVTDASGHFKMVVDLRTFTSTEGFALLGKQNNSGLNAAPLRDHKGNPIKFALPSGKAKQVDVGTLRLQ